MNCAGLDAAARECGDLRANGSTDTERALAVVSVHVARDFELVSQEGTRQSAHRVDDLWYKHTSFNTVCVKVFVDG